MTLHIFNPEHDLALASGLNNFTPPHAGRQLRYDIGFLPLLWTDDEDYVLVDDDDVAHFALQRLWPRLRTKPTARLVTLKTIRPLLGNITRIEPWGWDSALCTRLRHIGIDEALLPSEDDLQVLRLLSHRRTSSQLLSKLHLDGTVGKASECHSIEAVKDFVSHHERTVLKAPWSSSGRGVRFISAQTFSEGGATQLKGWLTNVIRSQGSVMVEPYYNKVKDFGMEFELIQGRVHYLGLSLFHTANGAYTGNILATEAAKREMLSHYLPLDLVDRVKDRIESILPDNPVLQSFTLPFGVDMMVVTNSQSSDFKLHPCVEVNLRRTMGHVAINLTRRVNPEEDDDIRKVMRIAYENKRYMLKINNL